jgi:signal transduction histidine kinase
MKMDFSILNQLLAEDCGLAVRDALAQVSKTINARVMGLYFLSLQEGNFKLFGSFGLDEDVAAFCERAIVAEDSWLSQSVPEIQRTKDNGLVFPINRLHTCIGLLKILLETPSSNVSLPYLQSIAAVFTVLYERRFIATFLGKIQQPINFKTVGSNEFYGEVMDMVSVASGMKHVALRELEDDGTLRCLGLHGFNDADRESFTFERDKVPDEFNEVIKNDKPMVFTNASEKEWVNTNPLLKDIVKSFIALPIKVGTSLFGILSFATTVPYEFSKTEFLALESISNGTGVAISNYRNFNEAKADIARYSEVAIVLSGLEIAQAARHEAKNDIDTCQQILADLLSSPKDRISDKKDRLNDLSQELLVVTRALDKIKMASRPPQRVLKKGTIRDIWTQALDALSGKIARLDINPKYPHLGKEPVIDMFPEWLRQAFLLLLLNSVDAFGRGAKKRNREISLTLDKLPDDAPIISMVYSDNAGGVDVSNLDIPDEHQQHANDLKQLIFCPNVTSKKEKGSGWGLYLVRKSIGYHNGSIDLTNYRGGVSFKITLPRVLK